MSDRANSRCLRVDDFDGGAPESRLEPAFARLPTATCNCCLVFAAVPALFLCLPRRGHRLRCVLGVAFLVSLTNYSLRLAALHLCLLRPLGSNTCPRPWLFPPATSSAALLPHTHYARSVTSDPGPFEATVVRGRQTPPKGHLHSAAGHTRLASPPTISRPSLNARPTASRCQIRGADTRASSKAGTAPARANECSGFTSQSVDVMAHCLRSAVHCSAALAPHHRSHRRLGRRPQNSGPRPKRRVSPQDRRDDQSRRTVLARAARVTNPGVPSAYDSLTLPLVVRGRLVAGVCLCASSGGDDGGGGVGGAAKLPHPSTMIGVPLIIIISIHQPRSKFLRRTSHRLPHALGPVFACTSDPGPSPNAHRSSPIAAGRSEFHTHTRTHSCTLHPYLPILLRHCLSFFCWSQKRPMHARDYHSPHRIVLLCLALSFA